MRHGQRHRVPKVLQPQAIRQDRRNGGPRARNRRPSAPGPLSAKLGRKPPRFPLTLRAMLGSRHQGHAWNRSVFSLLSVLALLAFACLPAAASADSSGYEYGNETPSAYGSHKTPTVVGGGDNGGKAKASHETGGSTGGGEGGSGSGGSSGGNPGTGSGSGAGEGRAGNGSTNPQHANGGKDAAGKLALQEAAPLGTQTSDDDGGSSPMVPILIVLALLAAISAGIVIMRQRRQPDSSAAPKAG